MKRLIVRITSVENRLTILYIFLFVSALLFSSYLYFLKTSSFHFTDEYTNMIQGYFMTQGRSLYQDIFSHHQTLPNYMSFVIQKLLPNLSLYQLITYHRLFMILYGIVMSTALFLRFGKKAVAFTVIFETTKFFLFGNLFLAESFVVYPLCYLTGLIIEKAHGQKIIKGDYILSFIAVWFIIFMREAYVPAAVLLLTYIFWTKEELRTKLFGLSIMIGLVVLTLLTLPLKIYFYNVFTLNTQGYILSELSGNGVMGLGILKLFFYPFVTLLSGELNSFRLILSTLSILFISFSVILFKNKQYFLVILLWITLALLSIRYVVPGKLYYDGFHLLVWFGVMSFCVSFLLVTLIRQKAVQITLIGLFFVGSITAIISSGYFPTTQSKEAEFSENYTSYYSIGETIHTLSTSPSDTVFVDYWDTLIYREAHLPSSYQYGLFLPIMQQSEMYVTARTRMFEKNPPTFYYYGCTQNQIMSPLLTQTQQRQYVQLRNTAKKLTCLYVLKKRYQTLPPEIFAQIKQFGYYRN